MTRPSSASRFRRVRSGLAGSLAVVALLASAAGLRAQSGGTWSLAVRDVPVSDALDRLVTLTGIDLVFSTDVVAGRRAFCQRADATAEELLACVVGGAGLDYYRLSSGTYVVIRAPEAPPRFGHLTGLVVDESTGGPVPYAVVELADGRARSVTDHEGFFSLPELAPGGHLVVVRRLGYRPTRVSVEVVADAGVRRRILLAPTVVELEPLVVNGMERRYGRSSLGRDVVVDEGTPAPLQAGAVGVRPGRVVGVARAPFFADVHIQGGRAGEHLVRIDGAPVFEPVSLGRILGAFSPLAVERMTVRKAGFGASEGSLIGGAVDVEHVPARGGSAGATLLADPYAVNGRVRVPFEVAGRSGALLVAGRNSLWDVFEERSLSDALRSWDVPDPVLLRSVVGASDAIVDRLEFEPRRHDSDLSFNDLHLAADVPAGAFRTVSASLYRGTNTVGSELLASGLVPGDLNNPLLLSRDAYRWSNIAGQVSFHTLVGDRASAALRMRASLHSVDHGYAMIYGDEGGYVPEGADLDAIETALRVALDEQGNAWDGSEISEWAAEGRFDYAPAPGNQVSLGIDVLRVRSRVQLEGPYYRPIRSVTDQWRLVTWAEDRWALGEHWTLEPGLRSTWLDTGGGPWLEPRLAVRLDRPDGAMGPWSARVAAGVYRQFTNRFDLTTVGPSALVAGVQFWLPVDGSVEPPEARHLAGEWVWSPAPGWEVRAEAYHKWLDHLLDLDYPALLTEISEPVGGLQEQAVFVGDGEGTAWGAGVRATRTTERLRLQLGYDYSASERTFPSRFSGERQPAPWVEPHRLYAGIDTDVGGGFTVRLDGRGVWGRSWGLRRSYYDVLALDDSPGGPDLGRPGEDRLPALVDLDLAVGWSGHVGGTRLEVRGEVRNLLDRRNVLDQLLRRTLDDEAVAYDVHPRTLPGLTPLLTVRLSR